MTARGRITASEVSASFNKNIKQPFILSYIARPLANFITPIFYNSGWDAGHVTNFRMLIAIIACCVLATGEPAAVFASVLGYYVVYILDCVDGNLARLNNSASYWGKFLDGLVDYIYPNIAPIVVAVTSWRLYDNAHLMLIAFVSVGISVASQMVRARLSFVREWMVNETGPLEDSVEENLAPVRKRASSVAAFYVNLCFMAPLILLLDHTGVLYIYFLVTAQMLPESIWLALSIYEGKLMLKRPRTSRKQA